MSKNQSSHCIALYVNGDNVTYFDSFGVELIPKKIKNFIGNKYITTNICRTQANYSIMYGHFCVRFIDYMLECESLFDTNYYFL